MDNETVIEQFDALEQKIEHLIRTCRQLEAQSSALKLENQQLNAQLQEKLEAERQTQELKDMVRLKIDGLMGRLDELSGE